MILDPTREFCPWTGEKFVPTRPDQRYAQPCGKYRRARHDALRKLGPYMVRITYTPGALKAFTEWAEEYFGRETPLTAPERPGE